MCGIVALIGPGSEQTRNRAAVALDLLQHRGPDDRGTWADERAWLGTRRLAVIDTGPGGHQPMVAPGGRVAVTFNGEIFNYLELRDELAAMGYVFKTHSDTEVLLSAYLAWGSRCVERFNGMWAFVVWDGRTGTAFISRDRLGEKPLYYTIQNGQLAVASEPKVLLALYPDLRRVDTRALYEFLAYTALYVGDRSFYEGIRMCEPAYSGIFRAGATEVDFRRYWSFPRTADAAGSAEDSGSPSEFAREFADLFADSVRLRVRSDVPVGLTLSGGLDSSAVAATMAGLSGGQEYRAFTSVFSESVSGAPPDERHWARLAADHCPSVTLEEVAVQGADWSNLLRRVVRQMDGPGYSPAVVPTWLIAQNASEQGVEVILEGQGADELLGGYPQHAALAFFAELAGCAARPTAASLGNILRWFRGYSATQGRANFPLWLVRESLPLTKSLYRSRFGLASAFRSDFAERAKSLGANPGPRESRDLNERLASDLTRRVLPGLLHYGDSIYMAHGVEVRNPFLDHRLLELCGRAPAAFKTGRGESKAVLRAYLRRVGLSALADRTDKQGYPTSIDQWLSHDDARVPRQLLTTPGESRILEYCSADGLRRLIDRHGRGTSLGSLTLYRLISTEFWLRECISPT